MKSYCTVSPVDLYAVTPVNEKDCDGNYDGAVCEHKYTEDIVGST